MFSPRPYHWILFLLLVLLVAAAGLRPVWYDDAGHFLVIEQGWEQGSFCHPTHLAAQQCDPDSPFITLGSPLNYFFQVWGSIWGKSMWVARLGTVLFTLGTFIFLFLLVKRFFSASRATWALLLLVGNIQILSYGSQVLGELPMTFFLLAGIYAHLRWLKNGTWWEALTAVICWWAAVMCKSYLAPPLALALGLWWLIRLLQRKPAWGILGQALVWGLAFSAWTIGEQGGWEGFQVYLDQRSSYSQEFLTFEFGEALRFLFLKPLILLGTGAMALRIYMQRREIDLFLGLVQGVLLLGFLISAGYDRLGMVLLWLPAIYLAEFCLALWKRWMGRWSLRGLFALVFVGLFVQQTPWLLWKDFPGRTLKEEQWREALQDLSQGQPFFTYDQHYAWVSKGAFRLPTRVPSHPACEVFSLESGELFLAGPYGMTEYQDCVPWEELEKIGSIEGDFFPCQLYRRSSVSPELGLGSF